MAKVLIERVPSIARKRRALKITVNGAEAGTITDGELQKYEYPEGTYQLQGRMGLFAASNTLSINLSDDKMTSITISTSVPYILAVSFPGLLLLAVVILSKSEGNT
jgi:hypothetical protein